MRALFPRSVYKTVEGHALGRLGMTERVNNPQTLAELEPNPNLLGALLAHKGRADPAVLAKIRDVARRVVEELTRRLRHERSEERRVGKAAPWRGARPHGRHGDFVG